MIKTFDGLLEAARGLPASRIAVAGADDATVIEAVQLAEEEGLGHALLFGDASKIADAIGTLDLAPKRAEVRVSQEPCAAAIEAVSAGEADCVMKGNVPTNVLLKAILARDVGSEHVKSLLSHVAIIENPRQNRLLIATDGGIVVSPDAEMKAQILDNALVVARALGIAKPKVGIPALMEDKGQDIPSLNDARKLMEWHRAGRFGNVDMDGPFGVDVFLDAESAAHKGIASPCAGEVDILLAPNADACNIAVKMVLYFANRDMIGLVVGGITPVILVSRGHSARSKMISIALAKLVGSYQASMRHTSALAG